MRWLLVVSLLPWTGCDRNSRSATQGMPVRGDSRLTDNPASSLVTYNFAWSVAADDSGRVHAVWYDNRDGAYEIWYRRSIDGGMTWDAETPLTEADGFASEHPAIAVAGDHVYVAWHDKAAGGGGVNVFVRRSIDGGANWPEPAVTLTTSGLAAHPSIAAEGLVVQVAYGDASEIHTRRSDDGGESWGGNHQISETGSFSWVPNVAVSGELVCVAWVDYRDANEEEYLRRSLDGGRSWLPAQRLTHDPADSWASSMAIQDGTVHFFWFDRRHAPYDELDVEGAVDELAALVGATVEPIPARDPAVYHLEQFPARLQRKWAAIHAALPTWLGNGGDPAQVETLSQKYETRYEGFAAGWEVYYLRSEDGGAHFGPEVRFTSAAGRSERPSVAVEGDEVHVVWYDNRDHIDAFEETEVYYARSTDGGKHWDGGRRLTQAAGTSMHPTAAVAAGAVHVVWYDKRDGNEEIYYRRLAQ